jgi:hypothetical protein
MSGEINPERVSKRAFFTFIDDFQSIILATDGITDAFFPSESSILSEEKWRIFWDKILRSGDDENPSGCPEIYDPQVPLPDKANGLRNWLDFWSKGNHDDRTILIIN